MVQKLFLNERDKIRSLASRSINFCKSQWATTRWSIANKRNLQNNKRYMRNNKRIMQNSKSIIRKLTNAICKASPKSTKNQFSRIRSSSNRRAKCTSFVWTASRIASPGMTSCCRTRKSTVDLGRRNASLIVRLWGWNWTDALSISTESWVWWELNNKRCDGDTSAAHLFSANVSIYPSVQKHFSYNLFNCKGDMVNATGKCNILPYFIFDRFLNAVKIPFSLFGDVLLWHLNRFGYKPIYFHFFQKSTLDHYSVINSSPYPRGGIGGQWPPNFLCPEKNCFKHIMKTKTSPIKCTFPLQTVWIWLALNLFNISDNTLNSNYIASLLPFKIYKRLDSKVAGSKPEHKRTSSQS